MKLALAATVLAYVLTGVALCVVYGRRGFTSKSWVVEALISLFGALAIAVMVLAVMVAPLGSALAFSYLLCVLWVWLVLLRIKGVGRPVPPHPVQLVLLVLAPLSVALGVIIFCVGTVAYLAGVDPEDDHEEHPASA